MRACNPDPHAQRHTHCAALGQPKPNPQVAYHSSAIEWHDTNLHHTRQPSGRSTGIVEKRVLDARSKLAWYGTLECVVQHVVTRHLQRGRLYCFVFVSPLHGHPKPKGPHTRVDCRSSSSPNNNSITTIPNRSGIASNNTTTLYNTVPRYLFQATLCERRVPQSSGHTAVSGDSGAPSGAGDGRHAARLDSTANKRPAAAAASLRVLGKPPPTMKPRCARSFQPSAGIFLRASFCGAGPCPI